MLPHDRDGYKFILFHKILRDKNYQGHRFDIGDVNIQLLYPRNRCEESAHGMFKIIDSGRLIQVESTVKITSDYDRSGVRGHCRKQMVTCPSW